MFIPRNRSVSIVAPLALAGALLFTGCSASPEAPAADTGVEVVEEATTGSESNDLIIGTGITKFEDIRYGAVDSPDEAFNDDVRELALKLNAASPGGLLEININAHSPQRVDINLLTDNTDGTISAAQVTAIIDALSGWSQLPNVDNIMIKGFNNNFGQGEILTGAAEAGVNPAYLDEMDRAVEIPNGGMDNVWGS